MGSQNTLKIPVLVEKGGTDINKTERLIGWIGQQVRKQQGFMNIPDKIPLGPLDKYRPFRNIRIQQDVAAGRFDYAVRIRNPHPGKGWK